MNVWRSRVDTQSAFLQERLLAQTHELSDTVAERPMTSDRTAELDRRSTAARDQVKQLCDLAVRGLERMYVRGGSFVHTVRGIQSNGALSPRPEGDSLRYAAVVALGLSKTSLATQRTVLKGRSAAELAIISLERATSSEDAGAVALAAWAAAEVAKVDITSALQVMAKHLEPHRTVETVICSWILCAALASKSNSLADNLISATSQRLLSGQAESGLFPHVLPQRARMLKRTHVGCFADQVYPIQALSRFSAARNSSAALEAAEACARRIVAVQGSAGQWWWHYDVNDGSVVEGYPVYSVHQHAMAPMALLELWEAGGDDSWWPVISGLTWIESHPEVATELVSERDALVWRKVGRAEPRKAVRSISAVTTGLKTGWRLPGLDLAFPPVRVDYECRPYELGWLLYAWLSSGNVRSLRRSGVASEPSNA